MSKEGAIKETWKFAHPSSVGGLRHIGCNRIPSHHAGVFSHSSLSVESQDTGEFVAIKKFKESESGESNGI